MRVLWTHNFAPQVPNAGTFMHTLAAGVRQLGVEVELMYLGDLRRPGALLRARRKVRARSRDYDLLHAQFGSACALASAASKVPAIVSLRGSDWHCYRGPHFGEARHAWLAHILTRLSLRSFDQIITMSQRMTADVAAVVGDHPVATIADPVDMALFQPHSRQAARRTLFDTHSTDPWILFTTLSKTNPIKRSELAREAVRLAAQRVPGLVLQVASGLEHRQMPLFVASCDMALCTSTHEGWPNSLKEALACGIPFVSTDVSDMRLIALRHPTCKVGEADPHHLARLIVGTLAEARDPTLRDEVATMDVATSARRIVNLYADLLQRRKRAP